VERLSDLATDVALDPSDVMRRYDEAHRELEPVAGQPVEDLWLDVDLLRGHEVATT